MLINKPVDLSKMPPVGSYLHVEEKVILEFASELQRLQDDGPVVTWANQETAQSYYSLHGFLLTLEHMLELHDQKTEEK